MMQVLSRGQYRLATFRHVCLMLVALGSLTATVVAGPLRAGVGKVDVSRPDAGPCKPPLYIRTLALSDGETTVVLASIDAVSIGQIGHIGNQYLGRVRQRLKDELHLDPSRFAINASHCHGVICSDVEDRTVEAVRQALSRLEPVTVGTGVGHEDRIMENRRIRLKNGREADVRHAYSMPAEELVAGVGPVDPQIGVLRVDRVDGRPLAVVYNFAIHPILGIPSGENTADLTGFSSQVIEEVLGNDSVALFIQGCGGDVNPVTYKDPARPRDAEPLGNLLALSTLRAWRQIRPEPQPELRQFSQSIELPRADLADRIAAQEAELQRLVKTLRGTSLNLKTFLPLVMRHRLDPDFPSQYSAAYLQERLLGRPHLDALDSGNRTAIDAYVQNIHTMEEMTRVQTNLALLRMHHAQNLEAGRRTLDVEITALRVGQFRLLTFPGELTVRIGLNLKDMAPHKPSFIAGYTNGYIYYAPTAEQLLNVGNAQEDSDCLLAPEWQEIFEAAAVKMLQQLD